MGQDPVRRGWAPAVHDDSHQLGLVRFADDRIEEIHWIGRAPHPMRPESWQALFARVVPAHRGRSDRWLHDAAEEAIRALGGEVFTRIEVELPHAGPDEETRRGIERTEQIASDLLIRIREGGGRYPEPALLAAAIERSLTPYDHAVLQTVFSATDIPRWCRAVADRWWASEEGLRDGAFPG